MPWRPRNHRLGAMRQRINVQSATLAVDSIGQAIPTWANTFHQEPAAYEPLSGGETFRGKQVEAGISAVFTVHYRQGYTPEMRITYNSETYGIVYVKPIEGGRRFLELYCKMVPSG